MTKRRRSSESRQRLLKAAEQLFNEVGYEDTTLEQVAEIAGLHVQTLYRHFPSKNELAFGLLFENLDRFERFFANRTNDALQAWRDWVEINAKSALKKKMGLITTSGAVRVSSQYLTYWHQYEVILAEGIAADMNVDTSKDLRPQLIACMLIGANKHTASEFARAHKTNARSYLKALLNIVDTTIEQFGPILGLPAATPQTKAMPSTKPTQKSKVANIRKASPNSKAKPSTKTKTAQAGKVKPSKKAS